MSAPTVFSDGWIAVTTGTATGTLTRITGVKEITAPFSRAELADSVMGDTIEAMYPGVISAPVSVVCREDYDTSTGVNVNFYTRMNSRTKFNLAIKPTNAAASGTNPRIYYEGVYCTQANAAPSGAWGAAVENRIEFRPASGCVITYATST
jgi:hypothetical protein